jgi:hypothetical protein
VSIATVKATLVTPIQVIGEFIQLIKSNTVDYYKTTSLPEITKLTRIEPITVISRDCMNLEYTGDVLQSCLNIFAGYYLQAIALTARIGNVRATKVLDRLNPDRDSSGFYASTESYKIDTMYAHNYQFKLPRTSLSMEGKFKDMIDNDKDLGDLIDEAGNEKGPESGHSVLGRGTTDKILPMAANLAVGKMFEVEIHVDDKSISIPVNIRIAPAVLPDNSVEHMLTIKKEDNTLNERYHAWRAGRIGLIKDLILCQDLIDTHRKALMNDDAGVYSQIINRANNAKKFGLLTQNPSLVSASSIFVFSEVIAANIERTLGGKLSNPRIRQKAFENTYAMLLVVIDREWERVIIYHRGIATATEVSIKDIKSMTNSKGPDVTDILRSYIAGNSPSF